MFTERTSVGLDVHARSVVAAAIDGVNGEAYHLCPLQTSFGAPVLKSSNGEYAKELGMDGSEGEAFATYLKKLAGEGVLTGEVFEARPTPVHADVRR